MQIAAVQKEFIKNRKGQNVIVLVEETKPQTGLAFVMHGLSGFKEQLQIQAMADVFRENGYTVVRFDTTNTFGESDGSYEDATTTNYYEDLEDVIAWATTQEWYQEPFVLAGHSLGGICVALFAEKYPEQVKALAPISTVVSGKLSAETKTSKGELQDWKKTGWRTETSSTGKIKKLKWSHMEDRMKYDLLPDAHQLVMPVLMMVGDQDDFTPLAHQKILYEALPGFKELHIIKNAPHTFIDPAHLAEIKELLKQWLQKLS